MDDPRRDEHWMRAALAIARRAEGRTTPNPPVGAVVVKEEMLLGSGWTQPPGGPHAEVVALSAAGVDARDATLYVTLEPCTFHGRTPPCTDAILAAGIRRVVWAAHDVDPRIGRGAAGILEAAEIECTYLRQPAADELLAPFRSRVQRGRPLVLAKWAMSLDGRIATAAGDSRWITGPAARRRVHELRDRMDAIMVGIGTVLADDPELTVRLADHWRPIQHPVRVVVDSHARTPLTARLLDPALPGTTLIATVDASPAWRVAVEARGVEVMTLPQRAGRVDLQALLAALGDRGLSSLLVEGGASLLGALADEHLIDRVWAFVGPKLIGGRAAPGPLGGAGAACMAATRAVTITSVEAMDGDLLIVGTPRPTQPEDAHEPLPTLEVDTPCSPEL
ncbi:MAG TPA: bifunctional diaminohydroxyphosphoribosylaminopyrimidine deaminase/5-amino-6-(5-phosphoribosylamino)uracil reductase RibD [Herpetosiphonaceae bacterium]|nr:bifunctional diaminohydroxyphosphoribosylaminopyrimidine deaminase/5-amino-6-(5-phosphoribosylamino)uracil reductase RibD [Herpetosiphonaceae bacterium]